MITKIAKFNCVAEIIDEDGYDDGFYYLDEDGIYCGPYFSPETAEMNLQIYKEQQSNERRTDERYA